MRSRAHLTTAAAAAVAIGLHIAAVSLVSWRFEPISAAPPEPLAPIDDGGITAIELTGLLTDAEVAALSQRPLAPVVGPADSTGFGDAHPLPNAAFDMPGTRVASRGGQDSGGPTTWTGREDEAELRQQSWNDPDSYQLPRVRTGRERRSWEALERSPDKGFSDRTETQRRRARDGQRDAPAFAMEGTDASDAPRLDGPDDGGELVVGDPAPERVAAAIDPVRTQALVDTGAAAVDAPKSGDAVDDVDAAGASNETNPMPFDLTRPRSGGDDSGVRGPLPGEGVAPDGLRDSGTTAALRAAVARGLGSVATRARRHDPYFRQMYARVDSLVEYPKDLALGLEQGEVVVRFTLLSDGRVRDVAVEKSSGFAQFDRSVARAISRAAPFGRVPDAITRGHAVVTVRAPYAFRNPWIR